MSATSCCFHFEELAGLGFGGVDRGRGPCSARPGGKLIAWLVVLSSFGALFGISVTGPRFFYAMAAERAVLPGGGSGRSGDGSSPPGRDRMLFAMTLVYLLTGTFEQIMGFYVAISLIYNMLGIAAIYPLRQPRRSASPVRTASRGIRSLRHCSSWVRSG